MNIACIILGTRGDVQPMVALADGLIKRGHEVTIYAPPENEELVSRVDCRFIPFGPSPKKAAKENPNKQKGGVAVKISPKEGKKVINDQINLLPKILNGTDLILGVGIVLGVHTAADILKVPYRFVIYYPIILGTTPDDPLKNRIMFGFGRLMVNMFTKGLINKNRSKFSLPPIKDVWSHWLGENVIVACDQELNKVPAGVSFPFTQTGFMLLPSKNDLPDNVKSFCNSGTPPVYIGFGSNPISDTEKFKQIFEKVSNNTNQRLIISKGWADLPESNSPDILYVDELPFDLLFPELVAAIHHGGTGTMSAIARAGIPQAAFPFLADQFANRDNIFKLGLGPKTCNFKEMTAESISTAINECINNKTYKNNALDLSNKLKISNGTEQTILLIEREFLNQTIAQQNTSSIMQMLVKHTWTKSHEQLGTITLAFKADSSYTVTGIPDDTIKGVFSLKADVLTFENENSCNSKGIYTITVTDETLNFVLKEDPCEGRNMITPGIWKALK